MKKLSLVLAVAVSTNYICLTGRSLSSFEMTTGVVKMERLNTQRSLTQPPPAKRSAPDSGPSLNHPDQETRARLSAGFGKLPLTFEANRGQTDTQVKFLSKAGNHSLFLTTAEAVLVFGQTLRADGESPIREPRRQQGSLVTTLRMKLAGANPQANVIGLDELPGKNNYFIGDDPKKWHTNVPTYSRVKYEDIYSGVDLIYHGNQQQIENDFVVAPGVDPRVINLTFEGVNRIRIDRRGDLVLAVNEGEIRQSKPFVYQDIEGQRHEIDGHYLLKSKRRVGIEVGTYDPHYPLVIDPVLSYSSYLGGSSSDEGYSIAVDSVGNTYVAGVTFSSFPTVNPLQPSFGGNTDAFVTKINSTGTAFVYSTYLGGSDEDRCNGIATDAAGNAYVTGYTRSSNFPTSNALQPNFAFGNLDGFVAKLDPNGGSLIYSTYLGGNNIDRGNGIAVDSLGNAYVMGTTFSTNFPTANPVQATRAGSNDAFVAKLDPSGASLIYSTYLGGTGAEYGENGIAVDSSGNAYVEGYTNSTDFPTVNPAQPTFGGGPFDAFITKLDSVGSTLIYSTYLGGPDDDRIYGIAVDGSGNAYVAGLTNGWGFPTVNALQPAFAGYIDAVVAKLNPAGSAFVYATYFGGSGDDRASGIAVDSSGNAYLTGYTNSTNFPTAIPLQPTQADNGAYYDTFVTKFAATGSALIFSSYLGGSSDDKGFGIAVDSDGNAYVTGYTFATNFPTTNPLQAALGGWNDAFVYKVTGLVRYSIAGQVTDGTGVGLSAVTVTATGSGTFTTQTDSNGYYIFASLTPGGNFTVTPSKTPYTFVPANRTFNNLSQNQTADFTIRTYVISGRVTDAGGNSVEDATIALSGFSSGTTQSDVNGNYSFINLPAGGNYTITPSKSDPILTYSFTPPSQNYNSLSNDQSANFTASTTLVNALYASGDAYVQDGTSASTNFGTVTPLKIQTDNHTGTGKNIDTYFRFDTSGVAGNVTNTKLRIYAALSAAGSISTSVFGVVNTAWIESGAGAITWNNKPPRNSTAITGATVTIASTTFATFDIDVTSYIRSERAAGTNVVSLALHNPSISTPFILLNSREASANQPQLVITTSSNPNAAPTVNITSPANGAPFVAPANITVSANASDSDGTISKVEFFAGTTLIGTDTSSPYQITWTNVLAGAYSLTAVATDDSQSVTTSGAVAITASPPNNPPTVSITTPLNNTSFPAASSITLGASASDGDGSINKVEFFAGTTLVGTATAPSGNGTYTVSWNNVASGAYSLTAKATDNGGGTTTSSAVTISVVSQTGLSPTADAYVRDGSFAATNFGTAIELQTQVSATSGSNRETYLKYDLTTVGGIANAKIRLFGRLNDTSSSNVPVAVYSVSNIIWTETGSGSLTWNNKPASGSVLATTTITDNVARWYEWDVTSYLQSEKIAGRNIVTLAIKSTSASNTFATFNSREATGNQPQLILWTTQARNVLLVVGSTNLNTGDSACQTRLQNLGYTVTVKAAGTNNGAVNTSDANGKTLVVISSTVTPANVAMKFRNVSIPVVTWEFDLLDDQGMTGTTSGTDFGTTASQTQLSIVNASHSMAAGLSGTVTAVTAASTFTWGKPNANAAKIASLISDATKIVIFGYDKGATMPGLEAPARRVAMFMTDTTAASFNANGGSLFDAAIKWATETVTAPMITSLNPAFGVTGTSVTIVGLNFGASQGTSTLSFNGSTATPVSWSDRNIVANVPSSATTGPVVVTVNGVASNGMTFAVGDTDVDGDGLSDSWELLYFGNLNQTAGGDPDGDGLTNLQEYLQGRNPTKSALSDSGDFVNLKVYTPLVPATP